MHQRRLPSDAGTRAARELSDAIRQYGGKVKKRWKANVEARTDNSPLGSSDRVRVDLGYEEALALAALIRDAATPPEQEIRGPIGSWLTAPDAALVLGVTPGTIRGWLTRHGPRANPFPEPGLQHRGRNYWTRSTIDEWKTRQDKLDGRPGRPGRNSPTHAVVEVGDS